MQRRYLVVDLSMPVRSTATPVLPGDPWPLQALYARAEREGFNANVWMLGEHTATHVDAPSHFLPGRESVDEIPIEAFIGCATAINLSHLPPRHRIARRELEEALEDLPFRVGKEWILLLHTGYASRAGTSQWLEHPELGEDACRYLVELGVKAIGLDAPSPDHEPYMAHRILLANNIVIYENLVNLDRLVGRRFIFIGLPLKLVGGTASPVRAAAVLPPEEVLDTLCPMP